MRVLQRQSSKTSPRFRGRTAAFILRRGLFFTLFSILPALFPALAEDFGYPLIHSLESRAGDPVFRQYQADVEEGRVLVFNRRRKESERELASKLLIYAYHAAAEDNLMRLAARCSVPYSAIATLNSLEHNALKAGQPLLLPSIPGLFIPESPRSDFERLLLSARMDAGALITVGHNGVKERYRFIPGEDFSSTERLLFLHPDMFRFPLRSFRLTSPYGGRISPVSGRRMNHNGLDLAAPSGAEVYAVKEGTVTFAGENAVYGNYVVITHDKGWSSLYGHLSAIETTLHKKVQSGSLIGRVGSTGLSTGPHLHFELRQNGKSQDPSALLK